MTDDPLHRTRHAPRPGEVTVREAEDVEAEDGMMELRLPIASTGAVRNEGDDPLSPNELRSMARQVDDLTTGVFPEHGMSTAVDSGGQYTQFEKLGYWAQADLQRDAADDGSDLLIATARMPDPETLPAATGDFRQALAIIKEQAKRGIPVAASIGWRDDSDAPGGVDLMEASIVGIGADPRTSTEGGEQLIARSVAAEGWTADKLRKRMDAAAEAVQSYTEEDGADSGDTQEGNADTRPLGPPGDRDRFDTFEECVDTLSDDPDVSREDAEQICGAWEQTSKDERSTRVTDTVEGVKIDITPPDAVVTAVELAQEAKAEEYPDELGDCGTGDGEETARRVQEGDLTAEYVADEIAAYLTSHAEDVDGITDPPSDWGEAEWLGTYNSDSPRCGPVQYALWAGTATGTGLEWAQGIANEAAEARGEELPYPDRAADAEATHDMSDTDDTAEDGGTTDTEEQQDASDGETQTRAPGEIELVDWAELLASHINGVDSADLMEAWEPFAEDYIGEVDLRELATFVGDVVDEETGAVLDFMEEAMGETQADDEEDEDDDEEDEDDDDERAVDGDLAERVSELEDELAAVRSGDLNVASPAAGSDAADADAQDDGTDERDAEAEEPQSRRDQILGVNR